MVAEIDAWERYPNGLLRMEAVVGWGIMPVTTGNLVLRIEYASNPKQMSEIQAGTAHPHCLQLGLTIEQASKLGSMLTSAVEKFEAISSKGGKAN